MKISRSKLKFLIKEVIKRINEAPFAGVEPMISTRKSKEQKKYDNPDNCPYNPSIFNPKAIDKFHRTPLYQKKASWAFAGFNIPIYIIPFIGKSIRKRSQSIPRLKFLTKNEFIDIVEKSGQEFDTKIMFDNLDAGACYIISKSDLLLKNNLPTPWMIFHAMFDNRRAPLKSFNFAESLMKVYKFKFWLLNQISQIGWTIDIKQRQEIIDRINLKNINVETGINDLTAEIITQEIATKSGFQVKMLNNENDKMWQNILDKMKSLNLKKLLEESFTGKIVYIDII